MSAPPGALVSLDLGGDSVDFLSGASSTYAWTSRLAQQSLQADFDPALVRLFDKAGQGTVTQASVSNGESVGGCRSTPRSRCDPGIAEQRVRLRRFRDQHRRRPRSAPCCCGGDRERPRRPDRRRAGSPERRGQAVVQPLPGRRSLRNDRWPDAGRGRLTPQQPRRAPISSRAAARHCPDRATATMPRRG